MRPCCPPVPCPRRCRGYPFFAALDPLSRTLQSKIKTQLREPFWLEDDRAVGLMEIHVDLGDRVLGW